MPQNGDQFAAPSLRPIPRFAIVAGGQGAVQQLRIGLVDGQGSVRSQAAKRQDRLVESGSIITSGNGTRRRASSGLSRELQPSGREVTVEQP